MEKKTYGLVIVDPLNDSPEYKRKKEEKKTETLICMRSKDLMLKRLKYPSI